MCTLSLHHSNNQLIVTSNRDEHEQRPNSLLPTSQLLGGTTHLFAQDALALGTWLVVNECGKFTVLLNGAFERHERQSSYRISRGQVLLKACSTNSVIDYLMNESLQDIEPFQVVHGNLSATSHFLWDGNQKHCIHLPLKERHFFCSPTLYNEHQRRNLEMLHEKLSIPHGEEAKVLWNFHTLEQSGNGLKLERLPMMTTSTSQCVITASHVHYHYLNHMNNESFQQSLELLTE